jgi:hypothetical protein
MFGISGVMVDGQPCLAGHAGGGWKAYSYDAPGEKIVVKDDCACMTALCDLA